jgi:hypothetical protein
MDKNVLSLSYRCMKFFNFESQYTKLMRMMKEQHRKNIRKLRNQLYYYRHLQEFRIKRKEYYEITGK